MGLVLSRKVAGPIQQAFMSLPTELKADYNTLMNCVSLLVGTVYQQGVPTSRVEAVFWEASLTVT